MSWKVILNRTSFKMSMEDTRGGAALFLRVASSLTSKSIRSMVMWSSPVSGISRSDCLTSYTMRGRFTLSGICKSMWVSLHPTDSFPLK